MDNYIILNMNLFTYENKLFAATADGGVETIGSFTIEELPKIITAYAYDNNIFKVKMTGSEKYSQIIEFGIGMEEMKNYSERKIEVEVI